jgi:hypothetical protein
VQVGEKHKAFAEESIFLFNRLLHLNNGVRFTPDITGIANNLSSSILIFGVGKTGEVSCLGLNQDLVARLGECFCARGCHTNPSFVVLNFFGYADDHGQCSSIRLMRCGD